MALWVDCRSGIVNDSSNHGHDLVAWILRRKIAMGQLLLSYQSAVDRKYHLCTQVNVVDGKIICIVVTDYMLRLAVLQVLNLTYNSASLAAWMFYSIM